MPWLCILLSVPLMVLPYFPRFMQFCRKQYVLRTTFLEKLEIVILHLDSRISFMNECCQMAHDAIENAIKENNELVVKKAQVALQKANDHKNELMKYRKYTISRYRWTCLGWISQESIIKSYTPLAWFSRGVRSGRTELEGAARGLMYQLDTYNFDAQ
jgi:hypothetical protein